MKIFAFSFFTLVFSVSTLKAQAPQSLNYQGVARDNAGAILSSQAISLQISILSGSPTGTVEYSETHTTTTNQFGLFRLQIGTGSLVSGNFPTIDWGANTHYAKVEMDETGGTNYQFMGTSQLLSVPYALYAENVNNHIWTETGNIIYYNVGNVGIGTTNPTPSAGNKVLHIQDAVRPELLLESTGTGGISTIVLKNDVDEWHMNIRENISNNNRFEIWNGSPRFVIHPNGNVGIGTTGANSKLAVVGLPVYANNSAAITGGLAAGDFYRTSTGVLMVRY
jgi:hypothetical protein